MKGYSKIENDEMRHFDSLANKYDKNYKYDNPFTKYKIDKKSRRFVNFVRKYHDNKEIRILEIGCGTGEYTREVAGYFPDSRIVAIDISEKILEVARIKCEKYKNISFYKLSAYKTSFKDNSFDVIFGFYILHHLDIPQFEKEIYRILKKGGLAFFNEPNILNPIVFLIKSNKYLKKIVGDSEEEWAINPLTITKIFRRFRSLEISITEFILPINILPAHFLIRIDKISSFLSRIPAIRYFGGSVEIYLQKDE